MRLRELWEWGFELGGRRYPWGTLARELAVRELRAGEAHGWPAIHQAAFAGHDDRPVTGLLIQVAAEANLHEEASRDALRARLDADLGPGEHAPVPHGPQRDRSVWRFAGVMVTLETYRSAWGFNWGRSGGRIVVQGDRERLAAPFLPRFRDDAWASRAADVEIVPAPGLSELPADETGLALSRPDLRRTPTWLALQPDQVAVWAGGVAGPAVALPIAPEDAFAHIRWKPARGSGYATLGLGSDRELLSTGPGETGLDAVAARLTALGVRVERVEETDWG